jgi:hypothetical protein
MSGSSTIVLRTNRREIRKQNVRLVGGCRLVSKPENKADGVSAEEHGRQSFDCFCGVVVGVRECEQHRTIFETDRRQELLGLRLIRV